MGAAGHDEFRSEDAREASSEAPGGEDLFARLMGQLEGKGLGSLVSPEAQAHPPAGASGVFALPRSEQAPAASEVQREPTPHASAEPDRQPAAPQPSSATPQAFSPTPEPPTGSPGEFTRIFTQLPTPRTAPPAVLAEVALPAPPLPEAAAPVPALRSQGEFTQFFQTLSPAPPSASAVDPVRAASESPAESQRSAPSAEPQKGAFDSFARPEPSLPTLSPVPERGFAPPGPSAFDTFEPAFSPPPAAAGSGGFTELLRSLGSEQAPPSAAALPGKPPLAPASELGWAHDPAPEPLRTFAPPATPAQVLNVAASGLAAPGEFTQLLQTLKAPSPAAPGTTAPAAPAPSAPLPEIGMAQASAGAGPSEYTRVIQASALRSAESTPATFAPAPPGPGAGVGLPIAPLPALPKVALPAAPKPPAADKSTFQKLLPWLLTANGVLLLLLLALVLSLLRHRH